MNAPSRPRRARPALNSGTLEELALRYVGRFATSRAKLTAYLQRKLRERGWEGDRQPDLEALTGKFCRLGYVDDAAYALAKTQALVGRGYGKRRVDQKLRVDGIGDEDGAAARALADAEAVDAALRFARRRRIGPYGRGSSDPRERDKAIGALVRAGHPFGLARAIVALDPDEEPDIDALRERLIDA